MSKHMMGAVTAYSATGVALSVVAGRLSYTMRLNGPALSVDTGGLHAGWQWMEGASWIDCLLAAPARILASAFVTTQFQCILPYPILEPYAACSSSLVSLHMAFNSLLAGQSSMAVNSGVNLNLTPDTFAMFQACCQAAVAAWLADWLVGWLVACRLC